jgi:hypothetical protein
MKISRDNMSKLFLSVRVTENFFSIEEMEYIKQELANYDNKSEFVRKAIQYYIYNIEDSPINNKEDEDNILKELRNIVKENQNLLNKLQEGNYNIKQNTNLKTYEGKEQKLKTDQALNLLNQF